MAYEKYYKVRCHSKKLVTFNFIAFSLNAVLANMVKLLLYSHTCPSFLRLCADLLYLVLPFDLVYLAQADLSIVAFFHYGLGRGKRCSIKYPPPPLAPPYCSLFRRVNVQYAKNYKSTEKGVVSHTWSIFFLLLK